MRMLTQFNYIMTCILSSNFVKYMKSLPHMVACFLFKPLVDILNKT